MKYDNLDPSNGNGIDRWIAATQENGWPLSLETKPVTNGSTLAEKKNLDVLFGSLRWRGTGYAWSVSAGVGGRGCFGLWCI